MSNYTFTTLNDKEFEQLAKDLLNAKFSLNLQDFKIGKDKGIDLRYSTASNNNSIVVQAKHYAGSAFAQLKHTLSNKELDKIIDLKPDRYIIVTSLPLSASQKDELKDLLSPYVLTSNDVIGLEDLNEYLSSNEDIEKKYFKLWFSSINVFNAVMNNAIEGRTKHLLQNIKEKGSFFVITKKFDYANKILQKEKILLITGQPGIGKTTLAELIIFERAKNNHKIYKVENITEAERVISPDNDTKQLFYFDDFLGANYFEIINAQKTESQLTSFVERIRNTPNKYLILTTRTIILNHATENYEKIAHSKLSRQQFEIKLGDYTLYEKALILYNHLYFNKLKTNLHNAILKNKFYKTIINHKNYTPRIIEFITDNSRISTLTAEGYLNYILNNLHNPKEIWSFSYNKQVEPLDRCFLITLFTLENHSYENELSKAFERRLIYEKSEHNYTFSSNQFEESAKILLNGFITSTIHESAPILRSFDFINPSLTDFLIGKVADSFAERKSILLSLYYIEQLDKFDPAKGIIPLEKELQSIIRDRIYKSELSFISEQESWFSENTRHATVLQILCKFCREVDKDSVVLLHLMKLDYDTDWHPISEKLVYVLNNLQNCPLSMSHIEDRFMIIAEKLFDTVSSIEEAKTIPVLFGKFSHDYEAYSSSDEGFDKILEVMENVLKSSEDELTKERKDEVQDMEDVQYIYNDLDTVKSELSSGLLPGVYFSYDFGLNINKSYWNAVIQENVEKHAEIKAAGEDYEGHYFSDFENKEDILNKSIDALFIKADNN